MAQLYTEGTDELVTGEAVSLDLPPAPFGLRCAAALIDALVAGILLFLAFLAAGFLASSDATLGILSILAFVIPLLIVPTTVETLTSGRSLGKWALGLRIVRDDAGPIAFRHAFIRSLIGVVELWVLSAVPAVLSSLLSTKGKRIGDFAAGTYAVRARVALTMPPPVPMPPPLAGWAAGADIGPIPERLLLGIRQVLSRSASMSPQSHYLLVQQLCHELGQYVAPPPPPGTPGDAYLAAVLAEHRNRDFARLQREQALIARLTGRSS